MPRPRLRPRKPPTRCPGATPPSRAWKRPARKKPGTSARWWRSLRANDTTFTTTRTIPICGWCSRRNARWPFSAAAPPPSPIRGACGTQPAARVKDPALLFGVGTPAATSRLDTSAQLTFYRDTAVPVAAQRLAARIDMLRNFTPKTDQSRRIAEAALSSLGLNYKSTAGLLIGLRDERLLIRKVNFEKRLRNAVEHDPKLGTDAGKVWDEVAAAYKTWTPFERPYQILEQPAAQGSALLRIARQVLRLSEERAKPGEQRPPEYRDTAPPALELALYPPALIDDALETALLTQYLEELKALGEKEVPLKTILGSKTPAQMAAEFVSTSKLKDVAERKRLAAGKVTAMQSDDGMLRLVRALDEPARKLLKKQQEIGRASCR